MSRSDDDPIVGLTAPQRAFLKMLTDQRIANLVQAADVVGDMSADVLSIIAALGDDEHKALRRFFWQVKPETLKFLTELREEELDELQAAVETYLAVRRTLKVMRWSVVMLFGAFVGVLLIWEKMGNTFRGGPPK